MEKPQENISDKAINYSKFSAFVKLGKLRLAWLVVFSAVITYITISNKVEWQIVVALSLGGLLVTAAANGFNQIIEKDLDALMNRTKNRPLPLNKISSSEGLIFCSILGIVGTIVLWVYTNPLSGLLGFLSILLYALVYTPLKRKSSIAVFVGAFPGAIPTLIGGVAASKGFGEITFFSFLLFTIQFVWQFPHFWSLAWFNFDDYARAEFYLLPSKGGKNDFTKFQILLYCLFLLIVSIFPFVFGFVGILSTSACVICGFAMLLQAYNFYRVPTDVYAKKLFFVTLVYLPLVQLALMTKL